MERKLDYLEVIEMCITSSCNLQCKHCYQHKEKNRYQLPFEKIIEVIDYAKKLGADECSVGMAGYQGLSVSSRDAEVENVEFSKSSGLGITVYKDHKKGSASTTDLSTEALHNCVQSALAIASYSNPDEFAGIAEKELLCTAILNKDTPFESYKISPIFL